MMKKYKNSILSDMTSAQAEERQAEEIEYSSSYVNRLSIAVRNQRENLMSETDWMSLSDSPTITTEWSNYRQALRDITGQSGFPHSVKWPTKPE
jgi:hypothetical protein